MGEFIGFRVWVSRSASFVEVEIAVPVISLRKRLSGSNDVRELA